MAEKIRFWANSGLFIGLALVSAYSQEQTLAHPHRMSALAGNADLISRRSHKKSRTFE